MLKYIVIAVIVLICIGFLTGYLFLNRKEDDSGRFEKKAGFRETYRMMTSRNWRK